MTIFLNGVSSSGKTNIATELLKLLDDGWIYMSVDDWLQVHRVEKDIERSIHEFHKELKRISNLGKNLLVDHVLEKESWYQETKVIFESRKSLLVNVWCSLDILNVRERERGNRMIGLAKLQFDQVYKNGCDLKVDTSNKNSLELAQEILLFIKKQKKLELSDGFPPTRE